MRDVGLDIKTVPRSKRPLFAAKGYLETPLHHIIALTVRMMVQNALLPRLPGKLDKHEIVNVTFDLSHNTVVKLLRRDLTVQYKHPIFPLSSIRYF